MKNDDYVVVLDCGATNVKAVAVSCSDFQIGATHSIKNQTKEYNNEGLIWDIDEIFAKLKTCCNEIMKVIPKDRVKAVSTTTFGVDGTFLDESNRMLYPIISWQCKRNADIMTNRLFKYFDREELFYQTGVGYFPFNTINKFIWFKENRPEEFEKAKTFLFISSYINFKLTKVLSCDYTMIGTSQLTDIQTQEFSQSIAHTIGYTKSLFKNIVYPGDIVGNIVEDIAKEFNLPKNIPVVSAGHDTQFAVFASGGDKKTAILSSGTWEVLMLNTRNIGFLNRKLLDKDVTIEFGCEKKNYNLGIQWLASGIIEWVRRNFYSEVKSDEEAYNVMISEVHKNMREIERSSVRISVDFLNNMGKIEGLSINSRRYAIYYYLLQSLARHLKESLEVLEELSGFRSTKLICVGGGTKNSLWNQIKADVLGIPIVVKDKVENTVLGASYYAMQAIDKDGRSAVQIRDSIEENVTIYNSVR